MTDTTLSMPRRTSRWNIALWVVQVLLAIAFGASGFMKIVQPIQAMADMGMGYVAVTPELLIRFIGVMEVLGALGMILPAATRIQPLLTPLAALGFAVIQVLAIGLHATLGETAMTLPVNLALLGLSVFVIWGRWIKAPISPR